MNKPLINLKTITMISLREWIDIKYNGIANEFAKANGHNNSWASPMLQKGYYYIVVGDPDKPELVMIKPKPIK